MIEWFPLMLIAGALPALKPMNERKKIEEVFYNINFSVPNKNGIKEYPVYQFKQETETYKKYVYRLPLGLTYDDKLGETLSKTLNRQVEIISDGEGQSKIEIFIYKVKIPKKWHYDELPSLDEDEKNKWLVPIGRTYKEMIWHDFDKIPHMAIAGMTRFGKTVLLKNIMTYLIEHHPDDAEFYIIDLKGGLEFGMYEGLKQVKRVADDLESAADVLKEVKAQTQRDKEYFKANRINNIVKTGIKRRTFIIVDEGAEIPVKSDEQDVLSHIARVTGALGYRLIFATQYPTADTLPREIKQNADAKVSFRLPTGYASKVALDETGAETLEYPGRAIYRTHDRQFVQVPLLEDEEMWERLEGYEVAENTDEASETRKNIIEFG